MKHTRKERFFFEEKLRGVSFNPIREGCGWVWNGEIKPTAYVLFENTFLHSHSFFLFRGAGTRLRRGASRGGDILF